MKKQAASLTILLSSNLSAQTLESVLVTGSYAPTEELTTSVSSLTGEQLQQTEKRSVSEALELLPGLAIERQGGPGGQDALLIRGAEANFSLIMLDGVPINNPTNTRGGGVDLAQLNPASIEKMELVRGTQSAVYGSDALAGVLNIVSRKPEQGHSGRAGIKWGEQGFSSYALMLQGAGKKGFYSLDVSRRDDGEPVPGSTRLNNNASLRLGWEPNDNQQLQLSAYYIDGERGNYPEQSGGPKYAALHALDKADYRNRIYALSWQTIVSEQWQSRLTANHFRIDETYNSPGITPFNAVPPNAADTDYLRHRLRWLNTLNINTGYQLSLGADYQHEEGDSNGYLVFFGNQMPTSFELKRKTKAVFTSMSVTAIDSLLLQFSLRYDDPDHFEAETTLNIGGRYSVTKDMQLYANWGEAFKLPSFFALGHPLVGNPDLQPETARSWDIGLHWRPSDNIKINGAVFFNAYKDLVDFDDSTFRNVNRNSIDTHGAEFALQWQATEKLSLRSQLSYIDIEVNNADTKLTGRPRWRASATAHWQLRSNWATSLDYRYNGEQLSASRHTGQESITALDTYKRLDWTLQWQALVNLKMSIAVDNLLDEAYETAIGFTEAGRSMRLGIQYDI